MSTHGFSAIVSETHSSTRPQADERSKWHLDEKVPTNGEHVVSEITLEIHQRMHIISMVVWFGGPWRRLIEARLYALRHKSRNSFVDRIVRSDSGQVIIDAMTNRVCLCSAKTSRTVLCVHRTDQHFGTFSQPQKYAENLKVNRKKNKWMMKNEIRFHSKMIINLHSCH